MDLQSFDIIFSLPKKLIQLIEVLGRDFEASSTLPPTQAMGSMVVRIAKHSLVLRHNRA